MAGLFFNLGKYAYTSRPPAVQIEEPSVDLTQAYDNLKSASEQPQIGSQELVAGETAILDCQGKIKGNVSSSGKIYHLPGGAFYNRTVAEICFASEQEAKAAGFRKSSR